ncbi:MAG: serine hydrolase domain-containing protein [Opitutales bacterium]
MRLLSGNTLAALATALLLTAPLAALTPADPASLGLSAERLARIDRVFEDYVADGALPGAVVLVARDGHIAHLGAYGELDREANTPMPEDALFRIASQTKAIVSVGILMLQEEGKLLIGDPVHQYLPAFENSTVAEPREDGGYDVVRAKRPITLRDLLTHTAGIGYGGGLAAAEWEAAGIQDWYFADRDEPIRATIDRLATLPQEGHPGERFVYGYSTDILGAVIEVASGQPLDVFLEKRVFTPLGMEDTHFFVPAEKADRLAVVYSKEDDSPLTRAPAEGTMQAQGHYLEGPRRSFSGGAGLVSTARDYGVFLQMLLDGGIYEGARLLSPNTVKLMTVDHLPREGMFPWAPGQGFGLGFAITQDVGRHGEPGSVGVFEWGGAYHSKYWVDPVENLLVVYFTQVIPADGLDDHGKLRALVYQAITESRAQTP